MNQFDWDGLVRETIRRRRADKLGKAEHASLAGVSLPTLGSFDRGDQSISVGKAMAIMRVVNLVQEGPRSAQAAFVVDAFNRWQDLAAGLPDGAPGRFPRGYVSYDYVVLGDVASYDGLKALRQHLEDRQTKLSGWPPFVTLRKEGLSPYVIDDVVECWLGKPGADRYFDDPAHTDFWRASPAGRFYLQRGYQEDSSTLEPGVILDATLPIIRLVEVLAHAMETIRFLAKDRSKTRVEIGVRYTGLAGRELTAWARPSHREIVGAFQKHRSQTEEVAFSGNLSAEALEADLAGCVSSMLTSLYRQFDLFEMPIEVIREEIEATGHYGMRR